MVYFHDVAFNINENISQSLYKQLQKIHNFKIDILHQL